MKLQMFIVHGSKDNFIDRLFIKHLAVVESQQGLQPICKLTGRKRKANPTWEESRRNISVLCDSFKWQGYSIFESHNRINNQASHAIYRSIP